MENGIRFPSKLEANYYKQLMLRQHAGEVVFFLRQVPFHLPGNVRYVVDFVVFTAEGDVIFVDVKGMKTPEFIMKKKLVEALYPVEITVLTK